MQLNHSDMTIKDLPFQQSGDKWLSWLQSVSRAKAGDKHPSRYLYTLRGLFETSSNRIKKVS